MKYEISEILNTALMTRTISIIVEGVDDIQVYDSIAKSVDKTAEIFPIETIEGYFPDVITLLRQWMIYLNSQHPMLAMITIF
jgi:capsule polysaccharide modification protein KpsS